jgi:hypothetical protein
MSIKQNNKSQIEDTEKLKEIPKWTRKYAQNRTLTILVLMAMAMLFSMLVAVLVGFPLGLAAIGFRKGNMILGCVGIAVLVVALAAISIFLIIFLSKFGGKNRGLIDQIIDRWIYGKEGVASIPPPKITKKMRGLDYFLGAIGLIYMLGINSLCMMGYITFKYQQPLMALYFVPAFVFEYFFLLRPKVGPLFLLWPILYTIHAILIVAGVPIFFTGNLGILNMPVPLIGYAFLAYVIGHIYSRYALKKLKNLTHSEEGTANGD